MSLTIFVRADAVRKRENSDFRVWSSAKNAATNAARMPMTIATSVPVQTSQGSQAAPTEKESQMRVAPPPDNTPDAKRDVAQALYTLVMNVAEAASQGEMPKKGRDGLTYLACQNIADTIVNLINASIGKVHNPADGVKSQFERYAATWEEQASYMSTVYEMTRLPSYRRIVDLGPDVVPHIIERMRTKPGHWFWALKEIVGEDKAAGAITLAEATRRWIEWYDDNHLA